MDHALLEKAGSLSVAEAAAMLARIASAARAGGPMAKRGVSPEVQAALQHAAVGAAAGAGGMGLLGLARGRKRKSLLRHVLGGALGGGAIGLGVHALQTGGVGDKPVATPGEEANLWRDQTVVDKLISHVPGASTLTGVGPPPGQSLAATLKDETLGAPTAGLTAAVAGHEAHRGLMNRQLRPAVQAAHGLAEIGTPEALTMRQDLLRRLHLNPEGAGTPRARFQNPFGVRRGMQLAGFNDAALMRQAVGEGSKVLRGPNAALGAAFRPRGAWGVAGRVATPWLVSNTLGRIPWEKLWSKSP